MSGETLIERVARALDAFAQEDDSKLPVKEFYEGMARAAIAAMREPNIRMCDAGFDSIDWVEDTNSSPEMVWRAMIDAALREGE